MNILSHNIADYLREKIYTGVGFFDELSDGLTPSQAIMFTGAAGSGKTTSWCQVADGLTGQGYVCAYVSAEQRADQLALLCERLGLKNGFSFLDITKVKADGSSAPKRVRQRIAHITSFLSVLRKKNEGKKIILMVDSLTDLAEDRNSCVMSASKELIDICQKEAMVGMFMLHENKNGSFRGPTGLKHSFDSYFRLSLGEEDEHPGIRYIESVKNRFGELKIVRTKLTSTGHKKCEKTIELSDEDIIEVM